MTDHNYVELALLSTREALTSLAESIEKTHEYDETILMLVGNAESNLQLAQALNLEVLKQGLSRDNKTPQMPKP